MSVRTKKCNKEAGQRCTKDGYFQKMEQRGDYTYCVDPFDGTEVPETKTHWKDSLTTEFWLAREDLCERVRQELLMRQNDPFALAASSDMETVNVDGQVDLNRYQGTWYEIARLPFKWERLCQQSWARYTWNKRKGVMYVQNTCKAARGEYTRKGEARPTQNPRVLQLVFNDGLPSDGVSNYIIEATDYKHFAIVGGENKEFLWILGRAPRMDKDYYLSLVRMAEQCGYDSSKLIVSGVLTLGKY